MSCMKCGNHTEDGQVFCAHCREVMENYPVKQDAHIQLPVRSVEVTPKKQPRKWRPARKDRQITALRWQIRWMWLVIIALLLAILIREVRAGIKHETPNTGKDYTYIDPTT